MGEWINLPARIIKHFEIQNEQVSLKVEGNVLKQSTCSNSGSLYRTAIPCPPFPYFASLPFLPLQLENSLALYTSQKPVNLLLCGLCLLKTICFTGWHGIWNLEEMAMRNSKRIWKKIMVPYCDNRNISDVQALHSVKERFCGAFLSHINSHDIFLFWERNLIFKKKIKLLKVNC